MKKFVSRVNTCRFWYIFLLPFLVVLFFIIATKAVNPVEYPNSDFFTFWLSGRLVSQGQNLYNSQIWLAGHYQFGATWIPNLTFIYPSPISLLFVPLGLLPLYQAFIIWDVLSQFMIVSSMALLLLTNSTISVKRFILPLMAGIVLFRPTTITLTNGQLSGMLLLLITCIIYLWEKGKWHQGAALLAILALKPNLGVPIIALSSLYLIQKKQITSLLAGIFSGLLLLFAGLLQNPNWIVEFWNAGNTKLSQTFGFSPTIWGMSAFFCDYNLSCILGYGISVALLFLTGYLYLLMKKQLPPTLAISLAVVITLLLTPYTWPYDQLLLVIPIITITMRFANDGYSFLPVSLVFLATDILAWILLGVSVNIQMEIWNAGVPLFILGLLIWMLFSKRPTLQVVGVDQ